MIERLIAVIYYVATFLAKAIAVSLMLALCNALAANAGEPAAPACEQRRAQTETRRNACVSALLAAGLEYPQAQSACFQRHPPASTCGVSVWRIAKEN